MLPALGRAVRLRRTELDLSQEQLAVRAGLDRTYVGAVERGERNVGIACVASIAEALELRTSSLLARAEHLARSEDAT